MRYVVGGLVLLVAIIGTIIVINPFESERIDTRESQRVDDLRRVVEADRRKLDGRDGLWLGAEWDGVPAQITNASAEQRVQTRRARLTTPIVYYRNGDRTLAKIVEPPVLVPDGDRRQFNWGAAMLLDARHAVLFADSDMPNRQTGLLEADEVVTVLDDLRPIGAGS